MQGNFSLRGRYNLLHFCKHLVRRFGCVKLMNQVQLFKVSYDGHGCLFISDKSFSKTLLIIVSSSATCRSSAQAPGSADLLSAVEEEDSSKVYFVSHCLVPTSQVVFIPWEAVDQEFILSALFHRPLQYGELIEHHITNGTIVPVAITYSLLE